MADSEISTTLPGVTRRRVLAGTVLTMGAWGSNALAGSILQGDPSSDPAIALWRQWLDVHQLAEHLCWQQGRLERQLAQTVGFPCATFEVAGGGRVTLHSLRLIHETLRLPHGDEATLARAEAEFVAHQARWDIADEAVGYSTIMQAERDASDQADNLLEVLAATSATSLAGVAAKLHAVLREGKIWEDACEFPWAQIQSALDDLARIGPQMQPGWSVPWDENQPRPCQKPRQNGASRCGVEPMEL